MRITIFLSLIFSSTLCLSQDCSCDHVIDVTNSTSVKLIKASDYTYQPGDVFCVKGGSMAGLRFIDFVGSEAFPLEIINCEGQVVINETTYSGIAFQGCQYIHLTGTGTNDQYGFFVQSASNGGGLGVSIGSLSSDVEVDHVEIANTGFAGIMAKTDPYCENPATWRRNGFVLKNLHIHDNYIHETGGEGMYVGFTGGYIVTSNRSCTGEGYIFGHLLENVNIHHNRLENIGWDGIQVNLVVKNAQIHHNEIIGYGTEEETFQNSGMSLGASDFKVYNNLVLQNFESSLEDNGMTVIGALSGSMFYNNVIAFCAANGMFVHNRYPFEDLDNGYYFMHNTIIETGKPGIFYNGGITKAENASLVGDKQLEADIRFYNNLVFDPGTDYTLQNFWKKNDESFIDFITPETRDIAIQDGNLFTRDRNALFFDDYNDNNFRVSNSSSPVVNGGVTIPFNGPADDYDGKDRVFDNITDVGAFELDVIASLFGNSTEATPSLLFPNPVIDNATLSNYSKYTITSVSGHFVQEGEGETLNLEQLKTGLYIIKTEQGSQVFLKKQR